MVQQNNDATTKKVKKPRGGFTQIYNAFLDSDKLTKSDKMVFIAIKSFANNETKQAYPSLATISRISEVSLPQVRRSITKMQKMGILKVEARTDDYNNGRMSNLYTVYDSPDMWDDDFSTEEEDFKVVAREIPDDILEAEYKRRHPDMSIKKEPSSEDTDQSISGEDTLKNQFSNTNSSMKNGGGQEYSMDFLHDHYSYWVLEHDHPIMIRDIDYIFQILYDTLNCTQDTIRVQKENRPAGVVKSQLLKLDYEEIMYVIRKYKEQTDRIDHPKAYLLTQLYEAVGQHNADITNQVQYDMNHWNEE